MDIFELYQALERLKADGEVVNAYGGTEHDIDHPDGLILCDLMDYLSACLNEKPIWLEAFFQVFSWQYDAIYEGVDGYYADFYHTGDYPTLVKVADYLKQNGYMEIAKQYGLGLAGGKRTFPDRRDTDGPIEEWVNENTELVWNFYLDILEKHKGDLFEFAKEYRERPLS